MARPRHSTGINFWSALDSFPPIMVRLAARRVVRGKRVAALSNQEIAIASGIRLGRVMAIAEMLTPDELSIGEARRFFEACNFDPTNAAHRKRQFDYIQLCLKKHPDRPPHYLRKSPHWESQFQPLIQRLKSATHFGASEPSASAATTSAV